MKTKTAKKYQKIVRSYKKNSTNSKKNPKRFPKQRVKQITQNSKNPEYSELLASLRQAQPHPWAYCCWFKGLAGEA